MKKITLLVALLFSVTFGFSQTFSDANVPHDLQNGNGTTAATCGTADELNLPLTVSGVGILGTTNSIESVEVSISHTWNSDVRLSLIDPSGSITLELISSGVGSSGDGFVNCVFIDGGAVLPGGPTTPVTGSFAPQGAGGFASFNSPGTIDADGDWILVACDNAGGDTGAIDAWSITFVETPSCPNPSGMAASNIELDAADLTWSAGSSEAEWNLEWKADADFTPGNTEEDDSATVSGTPTQSLSGLTSGTTYYVYYQANCGASTSSWIGPFTFNTLTPPPTNDECIDAVALTVNADLNCTDVTSGYIENATDSGVDACSGTEDDDVWYSFVATATVHRISLQNITNGTTDLYHAVYDGTAGCDNLGSAILCSDPNDSTVSGLTPGNTYYVQVYSWTATAGQTSAFDICITTPPPPPANDDCVNAEAYTLSEDVCITNTMISTEWATEGADELPTCDAFGNFGLWYTFTAPASGIVEFESGNGNPGLAVYDGTCGDFTEVSCLNNEDGSVSGLTPGNTYYAMIWTDTALASVDFCMYYLNCTPATVTYTVVSDCENSGGFFIDVEITDMGTATDITLTDDQGSASQAVTSTSTVQFGPYVNGTDVIITVADDNNASCNQSSSAITQSACPPVNDDVCNAIELTVGATSAGDAYTSTGATAQAGEVEGDCFNGGIDTSVWFTFVAPAGGEVTVTTDITGGTFDDTEVAVYEAPSDCSDASTLGAQVGCDQDGGEDVNFNSVVVLTGLEEGQTYYVQVDRWGGSAGGTFGIEVINNSLSTDSFELNGFEYYPNPVNDKLALNAQNNIQNVSVYNMLGQEVVRIAPNTIDTEVDMSNLQIGTYFVKVTINNATKTIKVLKK